MPDPMDDIATQARQGSVAAIIQTLNEKLATAGVRTRAVFADGYLQILCEAATPEQLEQSQLVAKIRQILEGIGPRSIRRVRINSRIVREQQLLWLEEITRDPENQLLWSEDIILAKPNLFKRLGENFKNQQTAPKKQPAFPEISSFRNTHKKNSYKRGIISGVSLSLILLLLGWLLYHWFGPKLNPQLDTQSQNSTSNPASTPKSGSTVADSFVQAVRLAEQASVSSQNVKTSAQWLDVAAKWERAADLMSEVKPDDNRYKTAQGRTILYRKNSEVAQKQAKQKRL